MPVQPPRSRSCLGHLALQPLLPRTSAFAPPSGRSPADAPPTFTSAQAVAAATPGEWFPFGDFNRAELTMWTCNLKDEIAYPHAPSTDELSFSEAYAGHGDTHQCYV
jgi:hypothetical protein